MNHIATKAHIKKQLKIRSQISDHEQSKASPLRGNFLISPDIESDVGGCFPLIFGILTILIDIMNAVG